MTRKKRSDALKKGAAAVLPLVAFLLILQTSCTMKPKIVYPQRDWLVATPESQGVDPEKLDAAMEYLGAISGEQGNSQCVVIRNGYMIWHGTDIDNKHIIWSCTKSFLSTCLGLLWDDGKCAPGDLAKEYFPALAEYYPTVTLEHLATFTSGYAHREGQPLEPVEPMYSPGTAFHYSRQSDLLAGILTGMAREPLEELFHRRIGATIGLTEENMSWGRIGDLGGIAVNGGAGAPPGAVSTTARAIARFGWLYCNSGVWDGRRLIGERYIQYASAPRVPPTMPPHDRDAWYVDLPGSYGLNWWVNGVTPGGRRMWPNAPETTFAAQGNRNNICFILPDWRMVIVRLGTDKIIDTDLYDRMFELIAEGMDR